VHQPYSRLVIDCNRPPHVAQAFPEHVDGTAIPGNVAMTQANAAARVAEIFHPYHAAIAAILDARVERETVLLSVHSYTPHHGEHPEPRPWPVSLLFDKDRRFSDALAFQLQLKSVIVGMNQPYVVNNMSDYAIPVHGEGRGLLHTLIEVRQDLIEDQAGQHHWGKELADCIRAAHISLFETGKF
jgi:predicted N-formylglutamate amidohydrolase